MGCSQAKLATNKGKTQELRARPLSQPTENHQTYMAQKPNQNRRTNSYQSCSGNQGIMIRLMFSRPSVNGWLVLQPILFHGC